MLQSLSGNNPEHASYRFAIEETSQVGEARRFALVLCSELDLDETGQGRVSIIVNELGHNLVSYGKKSQLIFRKFSTKTKIGIEILSIDSGPGMDDVEAIKDGFTTGSTPGNGLGAVKRQSDLFDIYSSVGTGTVIMSRVYSKNLSLSTTDEKNSDGFEVGAINVPKRGEVVSGDGWCVHETDQGLAVTIVDGLGHGPLAHEAAVKALLVFAKNYHEPVVGVLQKIHQDLTASRGAAVLILSTNKDEISYTGVGNITATLRAPMKSKALTSQNGTAGLRLGEIKSFQEDWRVGDYFVFNSDGLLGRWNLDLYPGFRDKHASLVAALLYRDFDRGNDDTTVVVVRRLS